MRKSKRGEMKMDKLIELQSALRESGHYAALVSGELHTNSMKKIVYIIDTYFVIDEQTGEELAFATALKVVDYMNATGDNTTMKVIAGTMTAEEARLEEINRSAIRRIDDWEFLMEQAKQFISFKKKAAYILEENEVLRKALKFYADPESYETDVVNQWQPVVPIDKDGGRIAKNALKGGETE